MAHHSTSPALPAGFRRRFPLELSPDEYARLEEAGKAAGSKRAALLAGLAALEELSAERAEAARLAAAHTTAQETIAALETKLTERERALGEAKKKATTHATRAQRASEEAEAAVLRAATDTRWADEARAAEHERRRDLEAEVATLKTSHVDELRCPRCGKFASSAEWATERTKEGRLVYHEPCGYHRGGLLDETSVLGRRAAS